ncbi:MAG: diadenylate cyclase CdaA [Eubacteriales bacterium]|nr:diadenylate cyclase CdaA [Eubacteriales bacterium]
MKEFFQSVWQLLTQIRVLDLLDIALLAVLIYQLIKLTRETRASQVLKGFAIVLIVSQVSKWLHLDGLAQLMSYIMNSGVVVLVILFQPELRRALERLGAGTFLDSSTLRAVAHETDGGYVAAELQHAIQDMAKSRIGALIVLQRTNTLESIIESGTVIDAQVSRELIENIFVPNTPLHDGATIINGGRIVAAGCFLPLTSNIDLSHELGTRHRSALGMSEHTDALVIVVSEETGIISVAEGGKLRRYMDQYSLSELLGSVYHEQETRGINLGALLKRRNGGNGKKQQKQSDD